MVKQGKVYDAYFITFETFGDADELMDAASLWLKANPHCFLKSLSLSYQDTGNYLSLYYEDFGKVEDNFRQGWLEAMQGDIHPIAELNEDE